MKLHSRVLLAFVLAASVGMQAAAQTAEKETFCRLLRDLCNGIPEVEQQRGRPRLPIGDALFSATFKVYSTVSARRFMTDMRDAESKGLVAHAPCYNSIFKVIESAEVTPIIQSLITTSSLPLRAVESDFAAILLASDCSASIATTPRSTGTKSICATTSRFTR